MSKLVSHLLAMLRWTLDCLWAAVIGPGRSAQVSETGRAPQQQSSVGKPALLFGEQPLGSTQPVSPTEGQTVSDTVEVCQAKDFDGQEWPIGDRPTQVTPTSGLGSVNKMLTLKIPRKRPVIDRGGRPRGSRRRSAGRSTAARPLKPEIMCWQRERQWFLGVELSDNVGEVEVLQDGTRLDQDQSDDMRFSLRQVIGEVTVVGLSETLWRVELASQTKNYLLFKLSGRNKGRRVKASTAGSYLVIAPDCWERDEHASGPAPVAPEPTSIQGYRAHYFDIDQNANCRIAFRTAEGQRIQVESRSPRFELVGNHLADASEKFGPLFGGEPPHICAADVRSWEEIRTIVVGREGHGRRRWRTEFQPNADLVEQNLPDQLAAKKGGWYFLRLYDANQELVESLDFRFVSGLKDITILHDGPLPLQNGHLAARIEFHHEPDLQIELADDVDPDIHIERGNELTAVTIPSKPDYDETRWRVDSGHGAPVRATILVKRVWWATGDEANRPCGWTSEVVTLQRADFAPTSNQALWIRLPKARWIERVWGGFEQARARLYLVRVSDETLAIPLREFADSVELGDLAKEHRFKLWLETPIAKHETDVAVLASEQKPRRSPPVACTAVGRFKSACARVTLSQGTGSEIRVNAESVWHYFREASPRGTALLRRFLEMPEAREILSVLDTSISVTGVRPGTARQAKAAAHALARALWSYRPKLKPLLKRAGFGGARVRKLPKALQQESGL